MFNFKALYQYRFRGVDQKKKVAVWSEISSFIFEIAGRPNCILDPAAGMGEFIITIPSKEKWIVDLEDYCGWGDSKIIKFVKGNIFDAPLPLSHFDCIFVSNFLEHLNNVHEIQNFLKKMLQSLKPNGSFIIMGPNFKHCTKEYFDYADHIIPLTDKSIVEHLISAGYEVTNIHPKFLPYSFNSILPASRTLTRIYLKIPLLWNFFGKQFLVTAKRAA